MNMAADNKKIRSFARVAFAGKIELAKRLVEDPEAPGTFIEVIANVRGTPVDFWFSRGEISAAQHKAAKRFEGLYVQANLAGISGIDYSRDKVDISRKNIEVSELRFNAIAELNSLRNIFGVRIYTLLCMVAAAGAWPSDVADWEGRKSEFRTKHLSTMARDALSDLAVIWNMA